MVAGRLPAAGCWVAAGRAARARPPRGQATPGFGGAAPAPTYNRDDIPYVKSRTGIAGLYRPRAAALAGSLDRWIAGSLDRLIARSSTLNRQPEVELDMRLAVCKGPAPPGLETGPVVATKPSGLAPGGSAPCRRHALNGTTVAPSSWRWWARCAARSNRLVGTPWRCLKQREKSDIDAKPQARAIAVKGWRG